MSLLNIARRAAAAAGVARAALVMPEPKADPFNAVRIYYVAGAGRPAELAREVAKFKAVRLCDFAALPWWNPDHRRLIWLTDAPPPRTLCPDGLQMPGGIPAHFQPTSAPISLRKPTWSNYAGPRKS